MREDENDEKPARTDNEKAKKFIQTYIKASTHTETLKGREKKLAEKQVVYKMRDATKKCKSCKGEKTGMCAPFTAPMNSKLGYERSKTEKQQDSTRFQMNFSNTSPQLESKFS